MTTTVQELINALSAYNPDANVLAWGAADAGTVDCGLLPDLHTHEDRPVLMIRVPERLTWRRRHSGLRRHQD